MENVEYYLSDIDIPYAMDEKGNEYMVSKEGKLLPAEKGTIDLYWGGITEGEAIAYANKWIANAKQSGTDKT